MRVGLCLFLNLLFAASLAAQQVSPEPKPTAVEDQVVKISTDLIRIDVTVTDKAGKVIGGLTKDDFEVTENGETQAVTDFSFVSRKKGGLSGDGKASQITTADADATVASAEVRRTILVVVDDRNISFPGIYYTRAALHKFVDAQMQPGDLVAILRTGGGSGAFQQFTANKILLHSAIDKIRWSPSSHSEQVRTLETDGQDITERTRRELNSIGIISGRLRPNLSSDKAKDNDFAKNQREYEEGLNTLASLGVVRSVIAGTRDMPGRKMMMFFSDGVRLTSESSVSRANTVLDFTKQVVDEANRASVVLYTFDTKGMQSLATQASDSTYEMHEKVRDEKAAERKDNYNGMQDGLVFLAKQTGGKALLNGDDLNGGMQRALDEQTGYYLIGYVPTGETFDAAKRKFNKLEVKLRRPGLTVSYRSGFFNSANVAAPVRTGADQDVARALSSPFVATDVPVEVNALFASDTTDGAYLRSFLHIDANALKFTDQPDGWKRADFEITAVAYDANGTPVDSVVSKYDVKAKGPTLDRVLKNGVVYVSIMPVKTAGLLQYRVAVRDIATGKIGSASQVVSVPDLRRQRLELSGIAVENVDIPVWQKIVAGSVGTGTGQTKIESTLLYDTVLRRFAAGTVLRYGLEAYNAGSKLTIQTRILQNDRIFATGETAKIEPSADGKTTRISGAAMINSTFPPGDYVLEVKVEDAAKKQTATQVFAFEVVR